MQKGKKHLKFILCLNTNCKFSVPFLGNYFPVRTQAAYLHSFDSVVKDCVYNFYYCFSLSYSLTLEKNFDFVFYQYLVDFLQFWKKKYFYNIPLLESYFITPTDSWRYQGDGPNSISTRILKLLTKDIPDQLAVLFNQFVSSGIFPSIWKTSKIMPIYKKDYKLKY